MNSGNVRAGTDGLTARKNPFETRLATGARSLSGSNGMLAYKCGLITIRLSMPRSSVWPSAADFATNSPARLPLPPTRFSTTTGCPSASPSLGAMRCATMSGPPPGGIGTSRRIGFVGYWAATLQLRSAVNRTRSGRRMGSVPYQTIARFTDPVQVQLPHLEVLLACTDHVVFHVQPLGEAL